jgi:hypothetical protein
VKLGFVLVCDAARLRADGLFDTIGAGAQAVLVDPEDRLLKRTVVVQLICDPEDVGHERRVDVALGPAVTPMDWRALHCAVHLVQVLEEEGDYRVFVPCEGEALGEWPLPVLMRDPEALREALVEEGGAGC